VCPARLTTTTHLPNAGVIGLIKWIDTDDSSLLLWNDTVLTERVHWEDTVFAADCLYDREQILEFGFLDTKKKRRKKKKQVIDQDIHDDFPDQNNEFHDENPE
jgi:hypothetical protein